LMFRKALIKIITLGIGEKGKNCKRRLLNYHASIVSIFILWDPNFPYGCRAMGFKGYISPSVVVYKSSGCECLLFENKELKS